MRRIFSRIYLKKSHILRGSFLYPKSKFMQYIMDAAITLSSSSSLFASIGSYAGLSDMIFMPLDT